MIDLQVTKVPAATEYSTIATIFIKRKKRLEASSQPLGMALLLRNPYNCKLTSINIGTASAIMMYCARKSGVDSLLAAYALVAMAESIMARKRVNGRRRKNMSLSPAYVLSLIKATRKKSKKGKKKASELFEGSKVIVSISARL